MDLNDKETLAYAAGFFDGEGCIVIRRTRGNTFWTSVRITSTDLPIIEWMRKNFGGATGVQPPNKNAKVCRPCWFWGMGSKSATEFLKKIAPLLVIKRQQADLAIEFQSRIEAPGVNRLTPEEIAIRETYKRRLVELKLGCQAETREGLFDAPYIAGLLDGEGTILIFKVPGSFHLRVSVVNTDLPVLERMKGLFGGAICQKLEKISIRTRPCWQWEIQGPKAAELLVELFPHLIIKKEQAKLALEFQSRKAAMKASKSSKEEMSNLGKEYKGKISGLNRRTFTAALA
jgi:hypothetical protein